MYKKIGLIFVLVSCLILMGCVTQNESDVPIEEEPIEIDLSTLIYFEYLSNDNPVITIKVKNYGIMKAQLFGDIAPNTVNNFIDYIQNQKFSNNAFHRIIKGFMIQGGNMSDANPPISGDFLSNGFDNPLKHSRGVLSMARTNNKNSATSQFFIMHDKAYYLDGNYAGFGGLISGFNVLDSIANVPTRNDAPTDAVLIESIEIDLKGYEVLEVIYFN